MQKKATQLFSFSKTAGILDKPKDLAVCYIVGAGEVNSLPFKITSQDFIIAADGGMDICRKYNIPVNLWIGDMDSAKQTNGQIDIITIHLSPQKDQTDTYAAVEIALQKGYKNICIYGGLGGSYRHTIANIQTLAFIAKSGGRGYLVNESEVLTVINNEEVFFNKSRKGHLSVFALDGQATGVDLKNLKYPLNNGILEDIYPKGVSNEFIKKVASPLPRLQGGLFCTTNMAVDNNFYGIEKPATVAVGDGSLLLVYEV